MAARVLLRCMLCVGQVISRPVFSSPPGNFIVLDTEPLVPYHRECLEGTTATALPPPLVKEDGKPKSHSALKGPKKATDSCFHCKRPFKNEEEGITALDKDWHEACFVCSTCHKEIPIPPGNFIVLEGAETFPYHRECVGTNTGPLPPPVVQENGKPLAKAAQKAKKTAEDKCFKCRVPFQNEDEGVTAIERDWHEECFTCTHCSKSIPIPPGNFVVREGAELFPYHRDCMAAELPAVALPPPAVNTLAKAAIKAKKNEDDVCWRCKKRFKNEEDGVTALGLDWHEECLRCHSCNKVIPLPPGDLIVLDVSPTSPYHRECVQIHVDALPPVVPMVNPAMGLQTKSATKSKMDPEDRCYRCHKPFANADDGVTALEHDYHEECFVCERCGKTCMGDFVVTTAFPEKPYHPGCVDPVPLSEQVECKGCGKIIDGARVAALGGKWHPSCFKCSYCSKELASDGDFVTTDDGQPFHEQCLDALEAEEERKRLEAIPPCAGCGKPLEPPVVSAFGQKWHHDCLRCAHCKNTFSTEVGFVESDGKPYHDHCLDEVEAAARAAEEARLLETAPKCGVCGKGVIGPHIEALNGAWHGTCLTCGECKKTFRDSAAVKEHEGVGYHDECLQFKLREEQHRKEEELRKQVEEERRKSVESNKSLPGSRRGSVEVAICPGCGKPAMGKRLNALNHKWHPQCFTCAWCNKQVTPEEGYVENEGKPYHEKCLDEFEEAEKVKKSAQSVSRSGTPDAPLCGGCGKPAVGKRANALGKKWHPECFVCYHCHKPFTDGFVDHKDLPYHDSCLDEVEESEKAQRRGSANPASGNVVICAGCGKPAQGKRLTALDKKWHPECLVCQSCFGAFTDDEGFVGHEGKPYHERCLDELEAEEQRRKQQQQRRKSSVAPPCAGCGKPTTGKRISAMEKKWHPECFVCQKCFKPFDEDGFVEENEMPYHERCLDDPSSPR
eukprot:TRINITY_DN1065_c0_g1_i2.p1 TRINITY_DN1065_c0_g1~~TRINITY_DN1065_c0_g1_i2.p1  ORF type:complete len:955 (-),score=202.24 TRINITY_DN1065_c0_g1_i2:27-2891(-)